MPARTVRFGFGPDFEMRVEDGSIVWRDEPVIDVEDVRLRGRFNLRNAMAAVAVCLERGIDIEGGADARCGSSPACRTASSTSPRSAASST